MFSQESWDAVGTDALRVLWCMFLEARAGLAAVIQGNWAPVVFQTGIDICRRRKPELSTRIFAQLEVKLSPGLLTGVGDISQQLFWVGGDAGGQVRGTSPRRAPHPPNPQPHLTRLLWPQAGGGGRLILPFSFFPGVGTSVGRWEGQSRACPLLGRAQGAWFCPMSVASSDLQEQRLGGLAML